MLSENQLTHLQDLGFRKEDCRRALIHCKGKVSCTCNYLNCQYVGYREACVFGAAGQLDQAATWLLENAESMSGLSRTNSDSGAHSAYPLSGVEVKAESVCICFIDDCLDCDVPLAELTFSREISLYVLSDIWMIRPV